MTPDQAKKIIGKNLQDARKKVRLTQHEVADAVGIDDNYYARIEQGLAVPSLMTLWKVLEAINTKSSKVLPF